MDQDRKTSPKIEEIETRIKALRQQEQGRPEDGGGPDRTLAGVGIAFRFVTELVSAVLVGGLIGYALDRWFNTAPWFLLVFVVLGLVAGVLNVYRAAKGLDDAVGLGRAVDERRRRDSGE